MITLCASIGWPDSLTGKLGAAVIKIAQPSRIYHTGLLLSDGWLYQSRLRKGVHRARVDVSGPDWKIRAGTSAANSTAASFGWPIRSGFHPLILCESVSADHRRGLRDRG